MDGVDPGVLWVSENILSVSRVEFLEVLVDMYLKNNNKFSI
jgi:hypothetical protein